MVYGLLVTLFVIVCFLLILRVLIQKGKGGTGLGALGGGTQILFGGSGGQDLFQKITWVLAAIFMGGSLILALMKSSERFNGRYLGKGKTVRRAVQLPAPTAPVQKSTS